MTCCCKPEPERRDGVPMCYACCQKVRSHPEILNWGLSSESGMFAVCCQCGGDTNYLMWADFAGQVPAEFRTNRLSRSLG